MAHVAGSFMNEADHYREVADLSLRLSKITEQYDMRNRECNSRANERAEICGQLEHFGLRLMQDGKIVQIISDPNSTVRYTP